MNPRWAYGTSDRLIRPLLFEKTFEPREDHRRDYGDRESYDRPRRGPRHSSNSAHCSITRCALICSGLFCITKEEVRTINAQMNIPEYITKEEVRRVCSAIGIRNWTALTEAKVKIEEAAVIQKLIGGEALAVSLEDFRDGLEVELEHGLAFSDADVTNNHPILTGKIVLAHLKETLDYYVRLRVTEIEGDMLKALIGNNSEKLMQKYRLWLAAKANLVNRERDLSRK